MAELAYTRVFDTPRDLAFRCMLEPEHLTHFWGPAGTSTEVRIHQAKVPIHALRRENQARFLTSLDRFAANLETLVS